MTTPRSAFRDLHPLFIEPDVVQTGEHRVFHPLVCCDHRWAIGPSSPYLKSLARLRQEEVKDSCSRCGAACVRDTRTGEMLEYELPLPEGVQEVSL